MPDIAEFTDALRSYEIRSAQAMAKKLAALRTRLDAVSTKRVMLDPAAALDDRRIALDRYRDRLIGAQEHINAEKKHEYVRLTAALDAMSPLKVLSRGYAIVSGASGDVIKSIDALEKGDAVSLRLADGTAECEVAGVRPL